MMQLNNNSIGLPMKIVLYYKLLKLPYMNEILNLFFKVFRKKNNLERRVKIVNLFINCSSIYLNFF